jgi:hypothetical protein
VTVSPYSVNELDAAARGPLANAVHAAAYNAFFHGFSAACLVAAGVSAVAAIGPCYCSQPTPQQRLDPQEGPGSTLDHKC